MVRKFWFGTLLVVLAAAVAGAQEKTDANSIKPLELAELISRSEGIALAKVARVAQKDDESDEATIEIVSVIKGNVVAKELKLELRARGEKGLDPELKAGQMGVFFLREITDSTAKLAHAGGVAIFERPNFMVSEKPKPFEGESNRVKLETSMGDIVIELDAEAAPVTVKNFLQYVKEGFYDGTVFHRVIKDFMVQSGGLDADMVEKRTRPPIVNEASNGLKNLRGTIAMARRPDPDSATAQFFINHKDNAVLNHVPNRKDRAGYAVFGKVVEGMEVVDAIAAVRTTSKMSTSVEGIKRPMQDVPAEPVVIKSVRVVAPGT